MSIASRFVSALVVLLAAGCASHAPGPTAEEKAALAPTGKLRLALLASNATNPKDPTTGEFRGPAVDVAKEMALRLAVPFSVVAYPNVAELVGSATRDEWDVISIGINPDREKLLDFTAPYMQTESGYLVKGERIKTMADVDRPGVRVAVLERGDSDIFLTKLLKQATLTRVKTIPDALELLKSGTADVHANIKTFLIPASRQVEGSRILDGYWQIQPIAFGVQKGRPGAEYVRRTINELKAAGFVKESVSRASVPGLQPAP